MICQFRNDRIFTSILLTDLWRHPQKLRWLRGILAKIAKIANCYSVSVGGQSFAKQQLRVPRGGHCGLLGLRWNKQRDTTSVAVPTKKAEMTKRDCGKELHPSHYNNKLLYRDACNLRVTWDAQLPADLGRWYNQWEGVLPEQITTVRALVQYQEPTSSINLHVFAGASRKGVTAAVFTVVSQPSS